MELISVTRAERDADLAELIEIESNKRYWEARRQQSLGRLASTSCPDELMPTTVDRQYVREEVSCALRITPDTARGWLADAADAQQNYPELIKLLEAGDTTQAHCFAFTGVARALEPEQKRALLDLVVDKARTQTVVEFRQTLTRALLKLRPLQEERSRRELTESRHMSVKHTMAGVSTIFMDLPTEDAVLSAANVEALALQWSRDPGETRTMEQLRVDAAAQLLQGGEAAQTPIGVNVCVSLSTLVGTDDEPAELDVPLPRAVGGGVVPVTADQARGLAAAAESFRRFVTDPLGRLLDFGRTTYRPPAALAHLVRARDRTCTFVHCTRPALRCDLDHRDSWQCGGETCELNLDCLCERHHYLKHNTTWRVERFADGTRQWTSPSGRSYTRPPATYPVDHTRSSTDDPLFRVVRAVHPPSHADPPPF